MTRKAARFHSPGEKSGSRAVGSEEKMAERLSPLRNIRRDVQPEEEDSGGGPAEEFPHTGPPEVLEFCEKVEAITFLHFAKTETISRHFSPFCFGATSLG